MYLYDENGNLVAEENDYTVYVSMSPYSPCIMEWYADSYIGALEKSINHLLSRLKHTAEGPCMVEYDYTGRYKVFLVLNGVIGEETEEGDIVDSHTEKMRILGVE